MPLQRVLSERSEAYPHTSEHGVRAPCGVGTLHLYSSSRESRRRHSGGYAPHIRLTAALCRADARAVSSLGLSGGTRVCTPTPHGATLVWGYASTRFARSEEYLLRRHLYIFNVCASESRAECSETSAKLRYFRANSYIIPKDKVEQSSLLKILQQALYRLAVGVGQELYPLLCRVLEVLVNLPHKESIDKDCIELRGELRQECFPVVHP